VYRYLENVSPVLVVRVLVHPKEEHGVRGLVIDEEGERVVRDELRVEQGTGRSVKKSTLYSM
jgi:hypothetical protein